MSEQTLKKTYLATVVKLMRTYRRHRSLAKVNRDEGKRAPASCYEDSAADVKYILGRMMDPLTFDEVEECEKLSHKTRTVPKHIEEVLD